MLFEAILMAFAQIKAKINDLTTLAPGDKTDAADVKLAIHGVPYVLSFVVSRPANTANVVHNSALADFTPLA